MPAFLMNCFLAVFTNLEFTLTGMFSFMDLKGAGAHEGLLAVLADVGSLTRMTTLVVREVTLSCETHGAPFEVAGEGLLAVVDPHVGQQVPLLAERFVATVHLADEGALSSLQI